MEFIQDSLFGKMYQEHSAVIKEKTLEPSLKNLLESRNRTPLCLQFRKLAGLMPTVLTETDGALRTELLTLNTGESPNVAVESTLSQILEADVPEKYYLSKNACLGILRRAKRRGKALPKTLLSALTQQIRREGEMFGQERITNAAEILQELRQKVGKENFKQWVQRAFVLVQLEEILFFEMCEQCSWDDKNAEKDRKCKDEQTESKKKCTCFTLQYLRENGLYGSTSQRQGSIEQLARQLDTFVQELSCQATPTEGFLHCLRQSGESEEALHETLSAVTKREISSIETTPFVYDARGNGDGETCPTITGDHNNRVTDYTALCCETIPIHDQATRFSGKRGQKQDGKGNGLGVGQTGDPMNTLTAADRHAVCYTMQEPIAAAIGCRNLRETGNIYGTLQAKPNGGQSLNYSGAVRVNYIVRRLTPTECARLQGFPDKWGHPDKKEDFTEEEYKFWLEVRNTYAKINGKSEKEYTKAQMLTWYSKLHTDSAEYKMWGNGIALPNALYVMQGIVTEVDNR